MASNEVWGIDIGKSSIKALKMKKVKNQLEIIGIEIVEFEQAGSEADEGNREEQIRQALTEFQARSKIKKEKVYVSIPGQATFNRLITIPPVEAKRISEIVSYEAQQQIPFPINEVIWDYQVIGEIGKAAEEREVMLFAVRKEIINNFLDNITNAGLKVDGIQIAPLAIYNFIRYEQADMSACVAIDIGAENTDLVVIDHDKLWLRALPSAGDDITKALQKRFNVPYQEAEKLKIKSGKTKQSKKIFEVMKPVLKDLVGEIHRSVGYYKSMSKDIKFEKMIFMGNATKLSGFEKFFSQNLQYEIGVLDKLSNIRVSPKINVNLFQTNIATFAVSMGLAIQGLGAATNDIKLLPPEMVARGNEEKQKPFLIAAVALMSFFPGYTYYVYDGINKEIDDHNKQIGPTANSIKEKEQKLGEVSNYEAFKEEVRGYSSIGETRGVWVKYFNNVNAKYLDANRVIDETRQNKIWLLGHSVKKDGEGNVLQASLKTSFLGLKEGNIKDPVEDLAYLDKYVILPLRYSEDVENKLFDLNMDYAKTLEEGKFSEELKNEFANNQQNLTMESIDISGQGDRWRIVDKQNKLYYVVVKGGENLSVYYALYEEVKISDTEGNEYKTDLFNKEDEFGEPKVYFRATINMKVRIN